MKRSEQSRAAARARRELQLRELRDGRRNRAAVFRSAKGYRRRPKHRGEGWA